MMVNKHDEPLDDDQPEPGPDGDLVAYLDGELSPADRRHVEHRLASDAGYRLRLRELQESWELLDVLPQATENKSLTETTVALATSEAALARKSRFFITGRQLTLLSAGALAGLLGFCIVYAPLKRRADRQLRDLPVAQNIDVYRYAEDMEFLQALYDQGIFVSNEEANDF